MSKFNNDQWASLREKALAGNNKGVKTEVPVVKATAVKATNKLDISACLVEEEVAEVPVAPTTILNLTKEEEPMVQPIVVADSMSSQDLVNAVYASADSKENNARKAFVSSLFTKKEAVEHMFPVKRVSSEELKDIWRSVPNKKYVMVNRMTGQIYVYASSMANADCMANLKFRRTKDGVVPYCDKEMEVSDFLKMGEFPSPENKLANIPMQLINHPELGANLSWSDYTIPNKMVTMEEGLLAARNVQIDQDNVQDRLVNFMDSGSRVYFSVTWENLASNIDIYANKDKILKAKKRIIRYMWLDLDRSFKVDKVVMNRDYKGHIKSKDGNLGFVNTDDLLEVNQNAIAAGAMSSELAIESCSSINSTIVMGSNHTKGEFSDFSGAMGKGDVISTREIPRGTVVLNGRVNFPKEVVVNGVTETRIFFWLGVPSKNVPVSQLLFKIIDGTFSAFQEALVDEFKKVKAAILDPERVWDMYRHVQSGWQAKLFKAHADRKAKGLPMDASVEILARVHYMKTMKASMESKFEKMKAQVPGTMNGSPHAYDKYLDFGTGAGSVKKRAECFEHIKTFGNVYVYKGLVIMSEMTLEAVANTHGGMDLDDKLALMATSIREGNLVYSERGVTRVLEAVGYRWPVGYREWFTYTVMLGDDREIKLFPNLKPLGDAPIGFRAKTRADNCTDNMAYWLSNQPWAPVTPKDADNIKYGEHKSEPLFSSEPEKLVLRVGPTLDPVLMKDAIQNDMIIGKIINAQALCISLGLYTHQLMEIRQSDLVDLAVQGECKGGWTVTEVEKWIATAYSTLRGEVDGILAVGKGRCNRVSKKWMNIKVNEKSDLMMSWDKLKLAWTKMDTLILNTIVARCKELRETDLQYVKLGKSGNRAADLVHTWSRLWSIHFKGVDQLKSLETKAGDAKVMIAEQNGLRLILNEVKEMYRQGSVLGENFQRRTAVGLLVNFLQKFGAEREDGTIAKGMDKVLFSDEVMSPLIDGLELGLGSDISSEYLSYTPSDDPEPLYALMGRVKTRRNAGESVLVNTVVKHKYKAAEGDPKTLFVTVYFNNKGEN